MIGGIGLFDNLNKIVNMKTKKVGNLIIIVGKTFGHLGQSSFMREIYSVNEGSPPEINLEQVHRI